MVKTPRFRAAGGFGYISRMAARRLLITAGPTHEPIDPVRYLANRSSGRTGLALAEAGRDAGWAVTLLLGPVAAASPTDVPTHRFDTTAELESLLGRHFPPCDVLIMAAAVADYRPDATEPAKRPRGREPITLRLVPTPDLVAGCAANKRADQRIIGFALESADVLADRAGEKLRRKGLDAIVANPLSTMDAAGIDASIYRAAGEPLHPGPMAKPDFARWLIEHLDELASRT